MLLLTRDEIAELTGKKTPRAQQAALALMGIPHLLRPDGTAAVLRFVVEQALGQRAAPKPEERRPQLQIPAARLAKRRKLTP